MSNSDATVTFEDREMILSAQDTPQWKKTILAVPFGLIFQSVRMYKIEFR